MQFIFAKSELTICILFTLMLISKNFLIKKLSSNRPHFLTVRSSNVTAYIVYKEYHESAVEDEYADETYPTKGEK